MDEVVFRLMSKDTQILRLLAAYLLFVSAPAASQNTDSPRDVQEFLVQRELCDHFRGEDPYDSERAEFLLKSISEACVGTDEQLRKLKEKYQDDSDIIQLLSDFEERIES